LESNNIKALFRRGKCYTNIGEYDNAKEDLVKASRLASVEVINDIKIEQHRLEELITKSQNKEQHMYKQIFDSLKKDEALYANVSTKEEPKTCSICGEKVEAIQYARHMIKKHSKK